MPFNDKEFQQYVLHYGNAIDKALPKKILNKLLIMLTIQSIN